MGKAVPFVLNAFRHQRFDTLRRLLQPPAPSSAQRLSASEIRHSKEKSKECGDLMCSTPFGIRDSTLLRSHQDKGVEIVLNAFRHQRFDTVLRLAAYQHSTSAQRLSASEIRHKILKQV